MKQQLQARSGAKYVILFLAADPRGTDRLALDREARSIRAELKRSGYRDRFDFSTRWAAEPLDLLRELRELRPTVVHFSGHGNARIPGALDGRDTLASTRSGPEPHGLYFQDGAGGAHVVSPEAIAQAFGAAGTPVKLVVLNGCFTEPLADALLAHVDCVIGLSGSIHDDAARSFAIGFYGGLGEHESVVAAFKQGRAAINLEGLPDAERPQLKVRDKVDATRLILAASAPSGRLALPCPYPGMRPYSADDADIFYGRNSEISELLGRLRTGGREIYVVGPSGSGKSSLLAAGVLPRLARGVPGLGPFAVRDLRPGERPATRLREVLEVPAGQSFVAAERVAALLAHRGPGSSVLIVVDQLEELFTLASASERESFLAALRALRAERHCVMIFTLRADFLGALMESTLWAEHSGHMSRIEVSPLRGEALREVISAPARNVAVTVAPELIERLLADAASEPGILPLLQETMVQLWDERVEQALTLANYQALGDGERSGLAVALARRADATLGGFTPGQRAIARRILLRLVSFGEGRADTRRQQSLAKLRASADDAADFASVLQRMIDDRLLTIDGDGGEPRVHLAHEIMIAAWPTLAGWTSQMRAEERQRRALEARADEWVERGDGESGLLDAAALFEAERWMQGDAARDLGYSVQLSTFIAASRIRLARSRDIRLHVASQPAAALRGSNHLLAIAVDRYVHYRPLANCVRDASDLIWILTSAYEFELQQVTRLFDGEATSKKIQSALDSYSSLSERDSLVIYFAGHGVNRRGIGAWIPVDAEDFTDYLQVSSVRNYLEAIMARHILVIVDSCFSGHFFTGTRGQSEPMYDESHPSRYALTAGRDELVLDGQPGVNSPFADSVKYHLSTSSGSIGAVTLGERILQDVKVQGFQTPRHGELHIQGNRHGQFYFHRRATSPSKRDSS